MNTGSVDVVLAQSIELPDLSGLPPVAQGVFYAIFVLALALSILIPRMGWLHGKTTGPAPSSIANNPAIAAVVTDPTALNAHTVAVQNLANVMEDVGKELAEIAKQMEIDRAVRKAQN